MTKSEQICNDLGAKFFCKDYVYENLKYFNKKNYKVELCDGLFEYCQNYVVLQIKERSQKKGSKSDGEWLDEIVYGEAVEQIVETMEAIKNNDIQVNDLYHQPVRLHKDYFIFPVVIFDNENIQSYKRTIAVNETIINVFNLTDYQTMLENLVHPYDIIYYLQERSRWCERTNGLPNFVFGESHTSTIIAKIANETDFARFFVQYIYDGKVNKQEDSLRLLAIIQQFKEKQIKKIPEYKKILNILQLIEPKQASPFIERFWGAWNNACKDLFDFSRMIKIIVNEKNIGIVFFSVGREHLISRDYYRILCDAKKQQHQLDIVLLICFIGDINNSCEIDWAYDESPYVEEKEVLAFYEGIGLFQGLYNKKEFEDLCQRLTTP